MAVLLLFVVQRICGKQEIALVYKSYMNLIQTIQCDKIKDVPWVLPEQR